MPPVFEKKKLIKFVYQYSNLGNKAFKKMPNIKKERK